jgi:hypothetical protein
VASVAAEKEGAGAGARRVIAAGRASQLRPLARPRARRGKNSVSTLVPTLSPTLASMMGG